MTKSEIDTAGATTLTLGRNMNVPKYVLLQCLPDGAASHEDVTKILRLEDLEDVVRSDPGLYWGENPRGPLPVKNSDGSVTIMKAWKGFSFTSAPGMNDFFICYEFADGICVHTEGREDVLYKCRQFAKALEARSIEY